MVLLGRCQKFRRGVQAHDPVAPLPQYLCECTVSAAQVKDRTAGGGVEELDEVGAVAADIVKFFLVEIRIPSDVHFDISYIFCKI